jgi:hypothetical protein
VPCGLGEQDQRERPRQRLPRGQNGSQSLVHLGQARRALALTGVELVEFKVLAPDGRGFGVGFDVATGAVVDPELVAARERQARVATYGKLAPSLHARLQHNPAKRVPVAIWVALPDPDSLARGDDPDLPALAARVRASQQPAVEAARALGGTIALADLVPAVFAELNAGQINALARHPAVVAIDYIPQQYTRSIDDAATSNRYPFVWSTTTGAGTKIAVHEHDGVDNANPFLNNPTHWLTLLERHGWPAKKYRRACHEYSWDNRLHT